VIPPFVPLDFASRLPSYAELLVRVGLNLQRGQRLLIAEPYELQGVARSAEVIVEAVRVAARKVVGTKIEIIWGDGPRLREYAVKKNWRGLIQLVAANARRMQDYVLNHDALLFLQGSQPHLLEGIPALQVAELRRIGWEHFGPVAQQLVQGATNWTAAPAPSPAWAHAVYADLPSAQRLTALWDIVFEVCRVDAPDPGDAWQIHLKALQAYRDGLNARRSNKVSYQGEGTALTLTLPPEHQWCTAQLTTKSGLSFVANLPTEEVFTLPHRNSAEGTLRASRPINYGGTMIDRIELVFHQGAVVRATAASNDALLQRLLATDEGAARLGEVALVLGKPAITRANRLFYHSLLDENATNHIALGEAYAFCLRQPNPVAMNRSLIHVDLSLDAQVTLT
jgi:aminopeptidase